jgi:hypothetical protein
MGEPANPTAERLLTEAADLLSDEGENAEYDRAIVELVTRTLGWSHDDHAAVLTLIRSYHWVDLNAKHHDAIVASLERENEYWRAIHFPPTDP